MKRTALILLFLLGFSTLKSHSQRVDTIASYILQQTVNNFQNLKSCSFEAYTLYDVSTNEFGLTQNSQEYSVTMQFPDKFRVKGKGDKGQTTFFYDGKQLVYHSFLKNQYAQRKAPANILTTIDTLSKSLGFDFPVADFFYPSFLKDLLSENTSLAYMGITQVLGKDCFHIAGKNTNMSFQFWISLDEIFVPLKMQIIYLNQEDYPRYEIYLSNWQFNEVYNPNIFHFSVPPYAKEIKFHTN